MAGMEMAVAMAVAMAMAMAVKEMMVRGMVAMRAGEAGARAKAAVVKAWEVAAVVEGAGMAIEEVGTTVAEEEVEKVEKEVAALAMAEGPGCLQGRVGEEEGAQGALAMEADVRAQEEESTAGVAEVTEARRGGS
jgi:hypothetical protein